MHRSDWFTSWKGSCTQLRPVSLLVQPKTTRMCRLEDLDLALTRPWLERIPPLLDPHPYPDGGALVASQTPCLWCGGWKRTWALPCALRSSRDV